MLILYLAITLLILLLVLILWWSVWRKSYSPSKKGSLRVETDELIAESDVDTKPAGLEVEEATPLSEAVPAAEAGGGLVKSIRSGVEKTRAALVGRLESLFKGEQIFTPELFEELEEVLMTSDFGMATTVSLVTTLEQSFAGREVTSADVYLALKAEIARRIKMVACMQPRPIQSGPEVIMVVGVNGVGKTTTIGKLASHYREEGKSVILAAGDTFRAAAAEQLSIWAERAGADIVRHSEGGDPAAVTFDAAKAAIARKSDLLIVDTAGRLHTKTNLMEELKKVRRVLDREIPGAPHQTLLVVDATTGQNALVQAKMFQEAVQVDGIVLTKLDGTAKGGVIVAICSELEIPVRFVGVGEGLSDLRPFDADEFAEALFEKDEVA
ncbi:MAG: signal recognition particle-docking protein FtsY [Desulfuromonadales bacterium]|nr:signal recognition particle-docking protein FtsY [Desulfuromonadales bacterium]